MRWECGGLTFGGAYFRNFTVLQLLVVLECLGLLFCLGLLQLLGVLDCL